MFELSVREGAAGGCYYLDIIKCVRAPVERRHEMRRSA
jgi:hypothetical protein